MTDHIAIYAGNNSDFRGKAAYWAARDSERAGKLAEARALYQGLQSRYDANWYGYLAKQRLETMNRNGNVPQKDFPADSAIGRAVANLQTVIVAEETAGPNEDVRIAKADQLAIIGTDDWALEELSVASSAAPSSPRVNLAIARIYRGKEDNVQALNYLKRSYPDYSQMKPEEMRPDEWDIFYPLAYWDIIKQESRARSLDPYQVAGLIRQESVFNPRAVSPARFSPVAAPNVGHSFARSCLRLDAGRCPYGDIDGEEVRSRTVNHHGIPVRAAIEYSAGHRISARSARQVRPHRIRRRGLQRRSTARRAVACGASA